MCIKLHDLWQIPDVVVVSVLGSHAEVATQLSRGWSYCSAVHPFSAPWDYAQEMQYAR